MKTSRTATTWSGLNCFTASNQCILLLLLALCFPCAGSGAEINAAVRDASDKPVADAVIVAVPEDGILPDLRPGTAIVDQINRQFVPYVKAITVGTSVSFPNKDNIRHHVYSFSKAKRFELPLYSGIHAPPVTFDKPGVVILGCNIHDWMIGYIYVSESPWFAVTGKDGRATIRDLPAGRYRVRAWHPLMEATEKQTLQSADLSTAATAGLSWVLRLKPDIRPRRAPVGGMRGYR